MLYIIGTGLNDHRDISIRSLEIIKSADRVYLESYTCIQLSDSSISGLEKLAGKKITLADRKMVEETNSIVEEAIDSTVVFLVAGTPFFATTHTDIHLRAKQRGIAVKTIHNISILNVMGCYGLYSYGFGRTVSIPYFTDKVRPLSFYDNICTNRAVGLHTLCLLDIKTDENRFMTANEAMEQIVEAEKTTGRGCINGDTMLFVVCRFATDEEAVFYDTIENLMKKDFGKALHSLIIPARLSCIEEEFVNGLFQ